MKVWIALAIASVWLAGVGYLALRLWAKTQPLLTCALA